MIKEKRKKTKYNSVKPTSQIIKEYIRTILLSFFVGIVITSFLAIHARSEMIKNLYAENGDRNSINKAIAEQIIQNTDLMADLPNKKYEICIKVGDLYMAVNDYKNAEVAYNAANLKDKPGMYTADYKLICALVSQEKFDKAELILNDVKDKNEKKLLKFKTRSYMVIGDKYYSIGKFLSAAKNYEKSAFYYNKFVINDKKIVESLENRIANSYIHSADIMVSSGRNSDAIRFLKKAEKLAPDNLTTKYRLGIVLSALEPEEALTYLEPLLEIMPQDIDYGVYCNALMKAANIADLEGRTTQAKYYRYKIHTYDLFIERKVVYRNDINIILKSFTSKKRIFTYPLKAVFQLSNSSNTDIKKLYGDFVLLDTKNNKQVEKVTLPVINAENPLHMNNFNNEEIEVKYAKRIFTKKELKNYAIEVYLYKDKKYKTLVFKTKLPDESF